MSSLPICCFILVCVDNNGQTCGRKFCGHNFSPFSFVEYSPSKESCNLTFPCGGCLHTSRQDIVFLCIYFQI
jgi:hypothetical protein